MKGKTLLCLALVTLMLLGIFMMGPVSAQPMTIGVEPVDTIDPGLGPGSTFTVEIWVREVADLAGVEFKLGYDTSVLTATLIEYGDIFGSTYFPLTSEIYDDAGYLHYSIMEMFGEPAFTGDGRAAIITFSVDSVGESVLDLYDTILGDSSTVPIPMPHEVLDGYFSNVIVIQYDLTIGVVGSGSTDPAPGTYSYAEDTDVEVDAIPDSGWTLDHWELDTVDVGATDPYTVTMDANHTLTAVFTEITPPPVETIDDLIDLVEEFYDLGYIDEQDVKLGLLDKLYAAKHQLDRGKTKTVGNILGAFINHLKAQRGKHVSTEAADILIADAQIIINNLLNASSSSATQSYAVVEGFTTIGGSGKSSYNLPSDEGESIGSEATVEQDEVVKNSLSTLILAPLYSVVTILAAANAYFAVRKPKYRD